MRFLLTALIMLGFAGSAMAKDVDAASPKDPYFTLKTVTVSEENSAPITLFDIDTPIVIASPTPIPRPTAPSMGTLGPVIGDAFGPGIIEGWITVGEKIWQIIAAGKPTVSISTNKVSVLSVSQTDWAKMDSWQGPVAKNYTLKAVNMMGVTVVSHTYSIMFNYNGHLNGAGHYIANATIVPSAIKVEWGYSLNSKVEFADAVNTGTAADPVPGLGLQVHWTIENVLEHTEGTESYFIKGNNGAVDRIDPTVAGLR